MCQTRTTCTFACEFHRIVSKKRKGTDQSICLRRQKKKLISEINQFFGILKGKGDFASFFFFFACGLCDTFRLGYLFLEDVPVFFVVARYKRHVLHFNWVTRLIKFKLNLHSSRVREKGFVSCRFIARASMSPVHKVSCLIDFPFFTLLFFSPIGSGCD